MIAEGIPADDTPSCWIGNFHDGENDDWWCIRGCVIWRGDPNVSGEPAASSVGVQDGVTGDKDVFPKFEDFALLEGCASRVVWVVTGARCRVVRLGRLRILT